MKQDVLLWIFLIIWIGVGAYLFYLDRQVRSLKKRFLFHEAKSEK
jgi:CcmD family protein